MASGRIDCTVAGRPAPPGLLAPLRETPAWRERPALLRERLDEDGYVLLRGCLERDAVMAARAEVFARLAEVGEVREPSQDGIATGASRRAELHPDLNAFWRSVCEGGKLRDVTHRGALGGVASAIFGAKARPFDMLWLRAMVGGRASHLHFDHVYMNRGSANVVTAWIPLGDVPIEAGPIVFVENAHRDAGLIAQHRGHDVDRDADYSGSFADDAVSVAQRMGTRLLSADFNAGDVVLFGMFTLHGSLDNNIGGNRIRLSCDMRWQPAHEATDERWHGAPPSGHKGQSYGGMSGARPLGSPAIAR
jgi:ectoine hydroxylase-related dioxygenase (phytanoyl-CoA dioxygenase family)